MFGSIPERLNPFGNVDHADWLLQAPFVVAMRMPALWWELATPYWAPRRKGEEAHRAIIEKAAAVVESHGAAQAQFAGASVALWLEAVSGRQPDPQALARAMQDIADASVEPHARRVRANYRRLRAARRKRA